MRRMTNVESNALRLDGWKQAAPDLSRFTVAKQRPTTPLYALAEEAARITDTKPGRWLRYGEVALRLALVHTKEKDCKNKAAFLTWACRHYATN